MRITYDQEADALYIRFTETTVTAKHLAEGIAADNDAEGRLAIFRLSLCLCGEFQSYRSKTICLRSQPISPFSSSRLAFTI